MSEEHATAMVQRYVNELGGDSPAESIVRDLLDRAVRRLHLLCATLLHRSYPRPAQPPLIVQADELLGAVAERLLKALREARTRAVTVKRRLSRDVWPLTDQLAELRPGGKPPDAI
jgi:hypothetical protein